MTEHDDSHQSADDATDAEQGDDTHAHRRPQLHPTLQAGVCESCGSNEHVHRGLCRHCRHVLIGEGELRRPEHQERPHQASPEPLHSPPWRRRGA